jgi:ADP-ribosyl-[dinitrogen reductase] hydrolase
MRLVDSVCDEVPYGWLQAQFPGHRTLFQPVRDAASGAWAPSAAGASINAVAALAAVVHVLRHAERKGLELADALRYAVSLGGDTDTIAAIVGGILGSRFEDVAGIPWLPRVALPDDATLDAVSTGLSRLRRSLYA